MSDGNKRYLGDVFINEDNYKRQKQFFKDIIESYQWKYGGNFDAATLQGLTPDSFATRAQGEKSDRALLSPIIFGGYNRQQIENIVDPQYIYTDAVLMDRANNKLNAIDWYENLADDDLTDALASIYDNVTDITNALDRNKLNLSDYETFYNNDYSPIKNIVQSSFQTIINADGDQEAVLDATLINGLRFILITQEAYDNLPTNKKNFWRNIYIIKDAAEIPADYHSPLQLDLEDGYRFRVHDGYLQLSNVLNEDTWENICTLQDLLTGANIDNIICNFIENGEYTVNIDSLLESLRNISLSNIDSNPTDYPFLSRSLHDDFVKDITINSSSANVSSTVDSNGFKNVNLNITNAISGQITPIQNDIAAIQTRLQTAEQSLLTESQNIQTVNTQIGNIISKDTTQDGTLNDILSELQTIRNSLSDLQSSFNSLSSGISHSGWSSYTVPSMQGSGGGATVNYYNPTLKLAVIKLKCYAYFQAVDANLHVPRKNAKGHTYPYFVVKAKPDVDIYVPVIHFGTMCQIDVYGRIFVATETNINVARNIIGSCLYRYDRLYTDAELEAISRRRGNSDFNFEATTYTAGDQGAWWTQRF